jgi:protocatechuate 3,4-dioxygenase beta subunit
MRWLKCIGRSRRHLAVLGVAAVLSVTAAGALYLPEGARAQAPPAASCVPTRPDALGPFYKPNAPVRSRVGVGHVLRGTVRSASNCNILPGARIEFWLAGPNAEYGDDYRATVFADAQGQYRFESHVPPGYAGRPPHIHIRASASGHQPLVTQYYPARGQTEGTFDLVLVRTGE